MTAPTSDIWAITTYYNPIHYTNRLFNYQIFKEHLSVPLLTIELSVDNTYELKKNDADILLQVASKSILWHKEKLLNIALKKLPPHVTYVAWLDCDIVFENEDWHQYAKIKLKKNNLIQLFSSMYDLKHSDSLFNTPLPDSPSGQGIVFLNNSGNLDKEHFLPSNTVGMRRGLFGLAWAAKRRIIEKNGYYDAMIIGSGDRALACAGFGRFQDAINVTKMSEKRIKHYLNWGNDFFRSINSKISFLEGNIFHLWHGELSNRRYLERHQEFAQFEFDPDIDLMTNIDGCWEWKNIDNPMHVFIKQYLTNRLEDGT